MLPNTQSTTTFYPHYRTFFIRERSLLQASKYMYVLGGERLNESRNCSGMFYEISRCQNIPRILRAYVIFDAELKFRIREQFGFGFDAAASPFRRAQFRFRRAIRNFERDDVPRVKYRASVKFFFFISS